MTLCGGMLSLLGDGLAALLSAQIAMVVKVTVAQSSVYADIANDALVQCGCIL